MRKGQQAMELLMTYGWVLLIVIAAVLVLAYNGAITADRFLADTCTATTPFVCVEHRVTSEATNNVYINIKNGAAEDMANVSVDLSCEDGSLAVLVSGTNTAVENSAGQDIIFTCPQPATGLRWKGNFTLNYTRSGETISHINFGTITTHVDA
jgi:hypothetical protein